MFELYNVSKKFGDEYALREISMEIGGGLSFLTGPSGSGKTTLLRILSGMEPEFEGRVSFLGTDLKTADKSWLYNDVFGFVWQDFHLLEDRTALENVLLPRYLKEETAEKKARNLLRELKIQDLADQKVGKLSGGQKQRIAIARELMKEPRVILADEPTSALDAATAGEIMGILRRLSKRCAVVVVTHDLSLIREGDRVYELDKGELASQPEGEIREAKTLPQMRKPRLTGKNALSLACTALSRQLGRTAASVVSVLVGAALLLTALSGAITGSGQSVFDELFATYGESLLDISLYSSFISAGGAAGQEEDGPKADVDQDLDGLFERYRDDERVEHVLFAQAIGNVEIGLEGKTYTVRNTNNTPVFRRLTAGKLPMGDVPEIAVPQTFVDSLGMDSEDILGRELDFSGTVFNWESGQPVETPVAVTATVVGVVDTTMVYEYNGQIYETPMEDSFFFSPAALAVMREGAGMKAQPGSFYIRCKTPADVISVKDELNAMGIVPLGRFELIEDMVRLNQQTRQQSGTAMWVIAALALVTVLAVAALTAALRRKEFAVLKVSGFSAGHLALTAAAEALAQGVYAGAGFVLALPLLNLGTKALWAVKIMEPRLVVMGIALCFGLSLLTFAVTAAAAAAVKPQKCLKTGDR